MTENSQARFEPMEDGKHLMHIALVVLSAAALVPQTILRHRHGAKYFDPARVASAVAVIFIWPAFWPYEDQRPMLLFGWAFLGFLALRLLQARWRDPWATGVPVPVDHGGSCMLPMCRSGTYAEAGAVAAIGLLLHGQSEAMGWFWLTGAGAMVLGKQIGRDARRRRARLLRQSVARADKLRRMHG